MFGLSCVNRNFSSAAFALVNILFSASPRFELVVLATARLSTPKVISAVSVSFCVFVSFLSLIHFDLRM